MLKHKNISNRLNEIFEARIGRILKVKQEHSKKPEDKRLWARIELFPSGTFDDVPFWGGGVDISDEGSKNPHGMFIPPRENQMVLILFIGGNFSNPFAAIPIPQPYDFSFVEDYYELMESVNDIALFHYSGSRLVLREDGSIDIQKRIEESSGNFVNHTLKIEFEYDAGNRKKTITDVDNSVIIESNSEDVKITDGAGQIFNMHFKAGEEKIEIVDKTDQRFLLDSTTGSTKVVVEKSPTQKIEIGTAKTEIKAPLLDMLGATESFIKGDSFIAGLTPLITAISSLATTPPATPVLRVDLLAMQTAAATLLGLLNTYKSATIKGE